MVDLVKNIIENYNKMTQKTIILFVIFIAIILLFSLRNTPVFILAIPLVVGIVILLTGDKNK